MDLFGETGEISLSCQILNNQLVPRGRIQIEMHKSKLKMIEILTLHQPRLELKKVEAAERLNCLSRTGLKEGDVGGHGYGWVLYFFLELFPITVMEFYTYISE